MSRTTQFIGLTKKAQLFVEKLVKLPSDTSTEGGMFGEEIPLGKWECPPELKEKRYICIREIVQDVGWSSGPMIFTCLELDYGNDFSFKCFEWVHNPMITNEYNYEDGEFWV